jgi:acetyl-CoA carboxylase carboxyl transferase subunit alpha
MLRLGIIDKIVAEPLGGAHRAPQEAIARLGETIDEALRQHAALNGEALRRQRRQKFLAMGSIIPQ